MGHNEREIELARSMARARGMEFVPRLTWSADYSPVVERDLVRIQTGLGAASRDEFQEKKGVEYTRDLCHQLWHAPVINWDGKMLGCCVNYWGDFGTNVFAEGLNAAMLHSNMEYARRMLLGAAEPRAGIPCTTCDQYQAMARTGHWLREEELQSSTYGKLLVGVVPAAAPESRFARISIEEGTASSRASTLQAGCSASPSIPPSIFNLRPPAATRFLRSVSKPPAGQNRPGESSMSPRARFARRFGWMPAPGSNGTAKRTSQRLQNHCPTGFADAA